MNAMSMNLRSVAQHERSHKGNVELAGILDSVADEIERMTADRQTYNAWADEIKTGAAEMRAEIERLRAALAGVVKHMDSNGMGDWPVAKKAKRALEQIVGKEDDR